MSKILQRLNARGIEHFARLKYRWVLFLMYSAARGSKDKHIYLGKKKQTITIDYIFKIITIILAFQYLTMKHSYLGHFDMEYLMWYYYVLWHLCPISWVLLTYGWTKIIGRRDDYAVKSWGPAVPCCLVVLHLISSWDLLPIPFTTWMQAAEKGR